jgi:uncharacterized protein
MGAPARVVVSGATGLVGRRLVAALAERGVAVRALTRHPGEGRLPGAESVGWDGVHPGAEALAGCDAVVHLAGEPVFGGRPTPERRRRIRASRIDSSRALAAAIAALPGAMRPRALVCASAVGYYGSRGEERLDEAAAPGDGFLARVCVDWEAAAREAEPLGVRVVCLRIGIVLAREGGALPRMALPFRVGLGGRLGDGRQWVPWVHVDDLVGLAVAALADEAWSGPVNATAPEPVRNAELASALGRALHRPALLPVPALAIRLALGELAGELLDSRRVLPRAALARGFAFRYERIGDALAAELG